MRAESTRNLAQARERPAEVVRRQVGVVTLHHVKRGDTRQLRGELDRNARARTARDEGSAARMQIEAAPGRIYFGMRATRIASDRKR